MDKFSGEKLPSIGIEQKEEEPKIFYHFLYGSHITAEDFKKFKSVFAQCDIYVPEALAFDWASNDLAFLKNISEGSPNQQDLEKMEKEIKSNSAQGAVFSAIYNSKKPILFVDIAETDELVKKNEKNAEVGDNAINFFRNGDFKEAIKQIRLFVSNNAEFELAREEKIKENLKNKIQEFIKEHPERAEKDELKVLITLGSYHTHLYQDIKRDGLTVFREFNELPDIFSSLDEAERRLIFKKEIDDEFLAHGLIEEILLDYLDPLTSDSNKLISVLRKISSRLDLETIKKISEKIGEEGVSQKNVLVDELKRLNIKVPRSEREMDEMLGIKKQ